MTNVRCVVFSILIWHLKPTVALPWSGLDLGGKVGSRMQRDVSCRDDLEYMHSNICCLNCPAGTYVKSPCTRPGERGTCEKCDEGTYTVHDNGLNQCFKCTKCRTDQEIVRLCTRIQDTECQCKLGRFCAHDEACEVCKKCSSCEKDEVKVRNCTAISNTECKKNHPTSGSDSASGNVAVIVPLVSCLIVLIVVTVLGLVWRRHCRATDSQRNSSDGLKDGHESHLTLDHRDNPQAEDRRNGENRMHSYLHLLQCRQAVRVKSVAGLEDERKELCDSLTSSASNSQHSLTGLPSPLFPSSSPRCSPMAPRQPSQREDEHFPKLVPVNGEESLRKCFEYFEELDIDYHKRFFRCLAINDNVIKSKEHLRHDDRIHELLNIWMEKVGKEANLNDLLRALLELKQKLTAENIRDNAISNGHYVYETE